MTGIRAPSTRPNTRATAAMAWERGRDKSCVKFDGWRRRRRSLAHVFLGVSSRGAAADSAARRCSTRQAPSPSSSRGAAAPSERRSRSKAVGAAQARPSTPTTTILGVGSGVAAVVLSPDNASFRYRRPRDIPLSRSDQRSSGRRRVWKWIGDGLSFGRRRCGFIRGPFDGGNRARRFQRLANGRRTTRR